MNKTDLKVRQVLSKQKKSKVQQYQELVLGRKDLLALVKYELIVTLFGWIPGALGLVLRRRLYPILLGRVGKNVIFGANVTLRYPHKIFIGDDVIIDDNCLLDAKGIENNGISIGNGIFIGRNTILSCKDGDIRLGDGVNLGFNCEIYSSSSVRLGENVLVAAYCYVVGGGSYDLANLGVPFVEQDGFSTKGGIDIGRNTWLAAHVVVLDGAAIGEGSVIGAGAVVRSDIPPFSVAAGIPATVLRSRQAASP